MNILITGIGGPTPRSITRSLKWYSQYRKYQFIGTDINLHARDLYDDTLYNKTYLIPRANHPDYWSTIKSIIKKHQIEIALIQPELEVLSWAERAQSDELPCKALLPDYKLAKTLINKALTTTVLENTDWVPPSFIFRPGKDDISSNATQFGYPFWIRATSGSSGLGSLKIENEDSFRNWIQINPKVKEFIGSKYLSGRNLACKLLYYNGELVRAACAERVNYIMAKVAPSGITGNTSFGRLINEPQLVETARKVMEKLFHATKAPKHGFFTIDFKEDSNGKPFVTEVNIRHVAFSVCFAAGGANFAEDTVRLLNGDRSFNQKFIIYKFEDGLIFLRDVDAKPKLLNENQLLK